MNFEEQIKKMVAEGVSFLNCGHEKECPKALHYEDNKDNPGFDIAICKCGYHRMDAVRPCDFLPDSDRYKRVETPVMLMTPGGDVRTDGVTAGKLLAGIITERTRGRMYQDDTPTRQLYRGAHRAGVELQEVAAAQ